MKYIVFAFCVLFFSVVCVLAQDGPSYENIKGRYFNNGYDITNSLPPNYSVKGDVDYTVYLQEAIDKYQVVIMPNFPVLINDNGLRLRSNQKILFPKNSVLILSETSKERYGMLLLERINNVQIYFPKLDGSRSKHIGTKGQWGMGIYIRSSQHVYVYGGQINNSWGDGVCVGGINGVNPKNITLRGINLDRNRRNGITIGAGVNILVEDVTISHTSGHNPQSGIDIEPDNSAYSLKNVNLNNVKTLNNAAFGIVISPGNLVGKKRNDISIGINEFQDNGSDVGLGLITTRSKAPINHIKLGGTISIRNFTSHNNKSARFRSYSGSAHAVKLDFDFRELIPNGKEISKYKKLIDQNKGFLIK